MTRRPRRANRRVQYATLTDAGQSLLERVAPGHVAEVRRLARLRESLRRPPASAWPLLAMTPDFWVPRGADRWFRCPQARFPSDGGRPACRSWTGSADR